MANTTTVGATTFTMPTDTEVVGMRIIEAPRELVWAAHTQCEHVRQWMLGPGGWSMPTCEIDLRAGGKWRYVFEGPDTPFELSGEYRDIHEPNLIVNTERMDNGPVETLNTLKLSEEHGRTLVHTVVEYPSKEIREQVLATGMLDGWAESYDRLEEYLRSMR